MTQSNIGYIIKGLTLVSLNRFREISSSISLSTIADKEELSIFFSGDHFEMMTKSALTADLYELSGFKIKPVNF